MDSYEIAKNCKNHCREVDEESQLGLLFSMPLGGTLEIRSSKKLDKDIDPDEEVEGVVYKIYWDGALFPMCAKTQLQATAIAFGCQWAAQKMKIM